MAWLWGGRRGSREGAWSPGLGAFSGSLSSPRELPGGSGLEAGSLPTPVHRASHLGSLVPLAGPLPDAPPAREGLCAGKGPAPTFLMWTLSGSDLEKKRRVLYRKRDPRRNSSMPVPSKAAVIT